MNLNDFFYNKGYDGFDYSLISQYLNDATGLKRGKLGSYKTHIDKDGNFLILKNKVIVFQSEFLFEEKFDNMLIDFMNSEVRKVKLNIIGDI